MALNLPLEDRDNREAPRSPYIVYGYIRYACCTQGSFFHKPCCIEESIRPFRVASVQRNHLEPTLQIKERLEDNVMAKPRRLSLRENE